jgi:hypothetical protein
MARWVRTAAGVFTGCVRIPRGPTPLDLGVDLLEVTPRLALVVIHGHQNVAALTSERVVAVMEDDETPDGVVVRIYRGHPTTLPTEHFRADYRLEAVL